MTMMPRIVTIAIEIGIVSQNAAVPAASRVNMIASVAYATDDRLSLEKTASAFGIDSRSSASSSLASGRPNRILRPRAAIRPIGCVGVLAAGRAVTVPGPVYLKYGDVRGATRTRR